MYPVGSIYISTSEVNPSTYSPDTKWEAFAQGKTLVGVDLSDTDFDAAEKTGGEKKHMLRTKELAHDAYIGNADAGGGESNYVINGLVPQGNWFGFHGGLKNQDAFNIMQPYVTVYIWRRTA